jgi:hypothetical protein
MGRIKQVRKITEEMAERIAQVMMQHEGNRKEYRVGAWRTKYDYVCYSVWHLCDVPEKNEMLGFYFDRQGIMHIERIPTALIVW